MTRCPSCGEESPERATFCPNCAAALRFEPSRAAVRKAVTVFFCDVTGSTALSESLDAESMRAVMDRYFDVVATAVRRHGGTVEKFIGDAVMAVFGVPIVHEDDAMRAVRAAHDARVELGHLNDRLQQERAVSVEVRIGVNKGEVVTGDAVVQRLVTGDAVNVAARLEQVARSGDILLGEATFRLVRDAVDVTPLEAIKLRGRKEPVRAYRLDAITGREAHERRLDLPMVGRDRELARLRDAHDEAASARRCHLFTLLGTAGVGKSRLVAEFLLTLPDGTRLLGGRCLAYGDGITYWPLREILHQAAAIADTDTREVAAERLRAIVRGERDSELVATRVGQAIGLIDGAAPPDELFWAARRVLETIAGDETLVVVVEDIHWAEQTFLDLIEHIADLARDAAILIVCTARPELLDTRPSWAGGKLGASTVLLDALGEAAADRLIDGLPGGAAVPADLRARINAVAEGNPLFLEEMLGMLRDDGVLRLVDGRWVSTGDAHTSVRVPATISALLAARLERLKPAERTVAGRASVIGRTFERDAVAELTPENLKPLVAESLVGLVRKELVRPERSPLALGDAFKFRHILIRDAAYQGLAKSDRADLHERFAQWLERAAADRTAEFEEILGYHIEQAYLFRVELGDRDLRTVALGVRAGRWLASAGLRARESRDVRASLNLLSRAVELLPEDDPSYWRAVVGLGDELNEMGDFDRGMPMLQRAIDGVADSDPVVLIDARISRLSVEAERRVMPFDEIRDAFRSLLRMCELAANDGICLRVWRTLGYFYQNGGRLRSAAATFRRAWRCAILTGNEDAATTGLLDLVGVGSRGTMPVGDGLALIERLPSSVSMKHASRVASELAYLTALQGRSTEALRHLERARGIKAELGHPPADGQILAGLVRSFCGDTRGAAAEFRLVVDTFQQLGDFSTGAPFWSARLAQMVFELGNTDEALELAGSALATQPDDEWVSIMAGGTRAKALARQGHHDEAVASARAVVSRALAARFDELPILYGGGLEDLGVVLTIAGDREGAESALRDAQDVYERKGALVLAERVRSRLQSLEDDDAMGSPDEKEYPQGDSNP